MDRRSFLQTTALGSLGAAALDPSDLPSGAEPNTPDNRPNVLVILADDMGFSDLGCYGSTVDTPNIDRLAEEGMRFSQMYNAARCTPTRGSLMTGLHPHQAGMGHMRADLEISAYRGHLNNQCVTMAEVLKDAGYNTLMSGKWHLGKEHAHWPNARGFDVYSGLLDGASDYFNPPPNRTLVRKNAPFAPKSIAHFESEENILSDFYMTDFFTDEAIDQLRQQGGGKEPFFQYLAYTAPHWPLQARAEDIEKYRGQFMEGWDQIRHRRYERLVDAGLIDEAWALPERDDRVLPWRDTDNKERWDLKMAAYAAQIDRMDQGIGQVLDTLEEMGERKNTLVLFLADNGAAAVRLRGDDARPGSPESYMSYHRPWAHVSDTPFRRYKIWTHEGGISTPFVANWPGEIDPGSLSHEASHVIDIMPTVLDATGASYPDTYDGRDILPVEGKSLLPVLAGGDREGHEALYWTHTDNHAIQRGRWKLVSPDGRETWQLYDMKNDRTETTDLADERPALVTDLAEQHQAWSDRVGVLSWSEYRKRRQAIRSN
ncbi:arylsulfatase [Salinibacter ruber]|jgi:arylsulfatase|uniref:Arylsulfatase n=1 Tax=Salinibacter ruber TaxID=146919 RepID=A0A9X2UAL2_9BACT|nr:arylsulfatase [Salinibacter ruber]MCS3952814.1 arylsulfatase [Salinibacter ruber]MCS3956351.1 arylsulfatase [Salinibacter ruber]